MMPRPHAFFITLENLNEIAGQPVRYLRYLPTLTRYVDLTLVSRAGALPEPFKPFFKDRIELPYPAGVRPGRYFLHPLGPLRLAAVWRALATLPSEPADVLYADSVLLAAMAARAPHERIVTEVNGALSEEFRHKRLPGVRWLYPFLRRWESNAYLQSDRLIAISRGVARYIEALAPATAGRINVLGNGVDPEFFHPQVDGTPVRQAQGWGDDPVGIFVSAFRPWHGCHRLVEMLPHVRSRCPGFRLALVGDGPERPRIQAMVERMGLREAVSLPGAVAPDDVPGWLAAATVGLYYPDYHSQYGFLFDSIKFYEYMALGMPSVTIRMPGLADPVAEADAGVFTDPTPEAYADGILTLLADPERMAAMGQRGVEMVRRRYTWEAVGLGIAQACGAEVDG